jgi:hypothetical protein
MARTETIVCDICGIETASMPGLNTLPNGWAIIGVAAESANGQSGLSVDVGPNCLATKFPSQIIPPPPVNPQPPINNAP